MKNLLRAKRVLLGINQDVVANVLGISLNSYSRKESGKTDFTQTEIKKLIEYFNLESEEIVSYFFA